MARRQRARRGSGQLQCRVNAQGIRVYYFRFTEKKKRRLVTLNAHDDESAEIEKAEILLRVRKGEPAIREAPAALASTLTVRELARRFCGKPTDERQPADFKSGAGAEHRDPVHYRRQFWSVLQCHVLPEIGDLDAMAVRPKHIKALRTKLLDDKKHNRTVQRAINHVSRLFNWAIVDEELVDRDNPCARIRKPKTSSSTEFYSEAEVASILTEAAEKAPGLHAVIAFAYYTGCRRGEIAALQWGDVDLEGGRIVVQRSWKASARKSGKPVVVHINPHLDAILRAFRPAEVAAADLVFPDPATGRMRDKFDTWGLRAIVDSAKARRFRNPWHSFRHAQATSLAASGASLTEIRDALGQSTLQMAANYSHLAAESVKKRIAALPSLGPVAPSKVASLTAERANRRERQQIGKQGATGNG
jgi:integrase